MWELQTERQIRRLSIQIEDDYGPPVIIIGMHRSGTSLVARLLRSAGGYFGANLDMNSEALTFMRFNHNFLKCQNVEWNVVPPEFTVHDLAEDKKALKCLAANSRLLWTEFFEPFGNEGEEGHDVPWDFPSGLMRKLLRFRKWPEKKGAALFWGWKDPRTTLTAAVWLKLFPKAKIIHVLRNGIDSALSLWHRALKIGEGEPHCSDLCYCFELWERYVEQGLQFRALPEEQYHEVRYEDLLQEPDPQVRRLIDFITSQRVSIGPLLSQIESKITDTERWKEHPELLQRACDSRRFLELGYGDLL